MELEENETSANSNPALRNDKTDKTVGDIDCEEDRVCKIFIFIFGQQL